MGGRGFQRRTHARDLSQPIRDLQGLEQEVRLLAESRVEEIVAGAYESIAALLPYHDAPAVVCILAANPQDQGLVDGLNGVVGTCIGANTLFTINPAGENWQTWIPYILAHERHHSAAGYQFFFIKGGTPNNLLSDLVGEGLADSFASQLCPDLHPSWVNALTPEEEARQWAVMQPYLRSQEGGDALGRRFFFGSPEQDTPGCTGYTIGFHIAQGYIRRHPEESVFELMDKDLEIILVEGGYPG